MIDGGDVRGLADGAKDGADAVADRAERAHDRVGRHVAPWADNAVFRGIARAGFIVTGLVYLLIGWVAIRMAIGQGGGESADQQGALKLVEAVPGGAVVLIVACVASFALAAWFVVEGIGSSAGIDDRRERLTELAKHAGKGVMYAVLGGSIIGVLTNSSGDAEAAAQDTSATLMQSWVGTALLVVAALVVVGVGVAFVVIGARRSFEKELDLSSAGRWRRAVVVITAIGYFARGLAFGCIGATLVTAAITRDPSDASGLSGALGAVRDLPFGPVLLAAIGVGLVIGGLALGLRARFQRM